MRINETAFSIRETTADYIRELERLLAALDFSAVEDVVECLCTARDAGATIYIAGNGGSAATASHWVNDLGKATKSSDAPPLRVMSLSDNVSWLTALGNDEGYERVFSGQLENFAKRGDVLIVISASGNSSNLIAAANTARAHGMTVVGLLGFDGGMLKERVDICLWLPTLKGQYGLVESGHSLLCHIVSECVAKSGQARTTVRAQPAA